VLSRVAAMYIAAINSSTAGQSHHRVGLEVLTGISITHTNKNKNEWVMSGIHQDYQLFLNLVQNLGVK
jgi:hypothetical protein